MPKSHKIYPNCLWHVPLEWFGFNFNSALLTKLYWNYATHTVRVCVSPLGPINPQLHVSKSAISMLNLVLKLWLVFTTFFAIILLHLWIHSSKNYSLIFLHIFFLISSKTSSTNTPRMTNQSFLSTLQVLLFILTIPFISPKHIFLTFLLFFCATPEFLRRRRAQDIKKGHRPRTTDNPEESPVASKLQEAPGARK